MEVSFSVVFAIYPNVQLDFTSVFDVLSRLPGATCVLASVDGGTVRSDAGLTFSEVKRLQVITDCVVLCVPGGFGAMAVMHDMAYLSELRRLATSAPYLTSLGVGSLLLAAAGLLEGKRAACHWAWRDMLALYGVRAEDSRVVRDGNVITGSGATAGIDVALAIMADAAGSEYAQAVQIALEYEPTSSLDATRLEHSRTKMGADVKH